MTVVGPFGLSVRDQALEADVQTGLAAVEAGLLDATKSDVPFITEAAQHLVLAGGKRFRPLLVMLAAQFGDPYAPGIVPAAVVVELTHLATLYHDDVMDEADVRRGVPSANTRWGNSIAVLTGDFLFARASHTLADLGPEAVRIQSEAFERLVTGQILETAGPADGRDPVDHYLDVLGGKTGSLVAVACRFGAMMAGADEGVVDTLTQYGERLGVAFQLADDVLDIASDSHESGKTPAPTCARASRPCPSCACGPRPPRTGAPRTSSWSPSSTATSPTTPGTPRSCAGCAPTRPWSRPAGTPCGTRRRPARCWRRCPTATPSRRSRSCATRWCTGRADPPAGPFCPFCPFGPSGPPVPGASPPPGRGRAREPDLHVRERGEERRGDPIRHLRRQGRGTDPYPVRGNPAARTVAATTSSAVSCAQCRASAGRPGMPSVRGSQ